MLTRDRRRQAAAVAALCLALLALPTASLAQPSYEATLADIEATLGSVPTFFRIFPPEALPGAWGTMKMLQLSDQTAIPGKYKELIGLAVAAQVPCDYCTYFHTEAARLNGASDAEIREAVATASFARLLSAFLNGSDQDIEAYHEEVDRMIEAADSAPGYGGSPRPVNNHAAALRDIEATMGFVPTFFQQVPAESLAPLWAEFKALTMGAESAIPPKYKDLIGLAVASQIPSRYCIYTDLALAEAHGASEQEIEEAIGMAAVTRHWSTFMNGMQLDAATYREQVDEVMNHLQQATASRQGGNRSR